MKTDFSKIESKLPTYLKIMDTVQHTNVATDRAFQQLFNGFYRIRQRSQSFYAVLYRFLEEHKQDQQLTYPMVLQELYSETGRIERSFSSKILATVRPEYPVWDQYVLENLGKKAPAYGTRDLEKIISAYDDICTWYQTDEARKKIAVFEAHFPNVPITDTKKIDFILWQTR